MCFNGQVKSKHYTSLFESVLRSITPDIVQVRVNDDDITTGFKLFSAMVYCSEPVALSQFLHNLISFQSPRTIIQATVNTIQSDNIKEVQNKKRMNKFYLALDNILKFQHGNILLALSSAAEIESLKAKDFPFFAHHSQELDQCLSDVTCNPVKNLGLGGTANEVSLHPPHLLDSKGSPTPAALVPFCAYQTNLTMLGKTRPDFSFPFCSKFKPTVLEGQLCYALDLNLENTKSKNGLKNGLILILDPGLVKETKDKHANHDHNSMVLSLNLEPGNEEKSSVKIYLNTLASFTDFRSGSYAMSDIKRMKGTDSFLELPLKDKNCQIETFEACQTKRYLEEVQQQCGCVPWALSSALTLKDPTFCSPNASACYSAISKQTHGCRVSCTGLYADVWFIKDTILKDMSKQGNIYFSEYLIKRCSGTFEYLLTGVGQ